MELNLTGDQWNTIVNALHVAVERYETDRGTMASIGQPALAEQFERQARETRALTEHISEQTGV